ncbi:MAG TPA: hypothetical protein VL943_11030 [Niabella sp.]|nr:hypothetical protein [Niabella sp.]
MPRGGYPFILKASRMYRLGAELQARSARMEFNAIKITDGCIPTARQTSDNIMGYKEVVPTEQKQSD